jgi:hypothetical protein
MRRALPALLRSLFADKNGRPVLWQRPNAPLIVWAVFTVLGKLLHTGRLATTAGIIAHAAILVWAVLEIGWGASYFRRTLGVIVLVLTIFSLVR